MRLSSVAAVESTMWPLTPPGSRTAMSDWEAGQERLAIRKGIATGVKNLTGTPSGLGAGVSHTAAPAKSKTKAEAKATTTVRGVTTLGTERMGKLRVRQ